MGLGPTFTTESKGAMPEEAGADLSGVGEQDGTLYEGLVTDEPPEVGAEGESDDRLVTVKIDGVESQVPLSEAVAGYQRQADYTRKTQEVSAREAQLEQANKLWTAFESDPERTLRALNAAYGIDGTTAPEIEDEQGEPADPRWDQVEQFMASQREREITLQIEGALAKLHTQHGEFVDDELIQFAIDKGIPDLDVAFAAMAYMSPEKIRARSDAGALAAKGNLPPVAGGHGVAGGSVVDGASQGPPSSVEEAFREAARSHGREDLIDF